MTNSEIMKTAMNVLNGVLTNRDMLKIMSRVSKDLFDVFKFEYWDNVVIAGGYAQDLLLDTNTSDDIDLFIYNANKELIDKIFAQVLLLSGGQVVCENGAVVTIANGSKKQVQIINASDKKTSEEVVKCFDIDCCKVYFDGYNLKYDLAAYDELKTREIDLQNVLFQGNTENRVAKYVQHKGWKLRNASSLIQNIDPLYLFKECYRHDKVFQNLVLLNNDTLSKVYNKIFIRKNPNIDIVKNRTAAKYNYGAANTAHKNIGLSSHIELRNLPDETNYNKFGLPNVLYNIKTGNYAFEDLYSSYDTDVSGFNTGCYMIMYEPSEEKVMEYFKNSEKFSSKNMNKYNLSYVELAALFNRLILVKFFLTKNNYKNVMKIAVHEDNVELYKMAYKLYNSDDRYLYKKPELLKMHAYTICEELYGELKDSEKEEQLKPTKVSNKPNLSIIDTFSLEQFFKYYCENTNEQKNILAYLKTKSHKNVIETESFRNQAKGMVSIEKKFYEHELAKLNANTKMSFNKLLMTIVNDENTYKTYTSVVFNNPLVDIKNRYTALRMEEGFLDPTYSFNVPVLNKLLVYLDNVKLIENNKNKKALQDNVLSCYKDELGPNFKEYVDKHYNCLASIKYYSKILCNTSHHDSAYDNCILTQNYERKENAIGYTPDDIIMFKTIEDYCNDVAPNENRSLSVKCIDRTIPIIPFDGTVNRDMVKDTILGIYDFENFCTKSNDMSCTTGINSFEKISTNDDYESNNIIRDYDSDDEYDVKPMTKLAKKTVAHDDSDDEYDVKPTTKLAKKTVAHDNVKSNKFINAPLRRERKSYNSDGSDDDKTKSKVLKQVIVSKMAINDKLAPPGKAQGCWDCYLSE